MFVIPNVPEIKRRREEIGLSQHQLSLQSDLSGCAISRIESGRTKRINHLRAREIAKVLDCMGQSAGDDRPALTMAGHERR